MRRFLLLAIAAATLAFMAAKITLFPELSAPGSVSAGATFPVKGIGFLPNSPILLCAGDLSNCVELQTDAYGELFQYLEAPEVSGLLALKAIQFPVVTRRGLGEPRVLTAETVVLVRAAAEAIPKRSIGRTSFDRRPVPRSQ